MLSNLNVLIVGTGAGLSYSRLGPTHHSLEDLGLMQLLPNLDIFCPGDNIELEKFYQNYSKIINLVICDLEKKVNQLLIIEIKQLISTNPILLIKLVKLQF